MITKKTIVCDIDGTLANIDHRLHFLKDKDWDSFYGAVKDDKANRWCLELLAAMAKQGHEIVFVTGRNAVTEKDTINWLNTYLMTNHPYELYMRRESDRKPDYIVKQGIYREHLKDRDILFVVEDRKRVVQMWREQGLTVLQCDEGEF